MTNEFSYLSEKIRTAPVCTDPFPHVYIQDFLSAAHFERVTSNKQIHVSRALTNVGLLAKLARAGYRPQKFPGCTSDPIDYLRRLRRDEWPAQEQPVEGFGMALRLLHIRDPWLESLHAYLNGPEFVGSITDKFGIEDEHRVETAFQKYLSGYEISPHPDIRRKLATYMVNINDPRRDFPSDLHTHLLRFKPEWAWLYEVWRRRPDLERAWVPWDWCESEFMTVDNNGMVMFAPSDDTLHAVRLRYDHRALQRTQIYGNLWAADERRLQTCSWRDLDQQADELKASVA